MKYLQWQASETLMELKNILSAGEVILSSTDTVLGLLSVASEIGKKHIDYIKKRVDKPYLLLVKDRDKVFELINIPQNEYIQFEKLTNICWPGSVTLIFLANKNVPRWMTSPEGTVAIRIPKHDGLQALLQYFPVLFSTSANITGEPIPKTVAEVDPEVIAHISAIVVEKDEYELFTTVSSTILDCTGGVIKVVRQGVFDVDALASKTGLKILY